MTVASESLTFYRSHHVRYYLTVEGGCKLHYIGKVHDVRRLSFDQRGKVQESRIFGGMFPFQYWFIDLLVGTPMPQRVSVILDTGIQTVLKPFTAMGRSPLILTENKLCIITGMAILYKSY